MQIFVFQGKMSLLCLFVHNKIGPSNKVGRPKVDSDARHVFKKAENHNIENKKLSSFFFLI